MYKRSEMINMQRPISARIPMDRKRRAKQFAPFQALKGFEHSVREKEMVFEPRKEQYEGVRSGIDRKLAEIGNRDVCVTYYLESSIKPGFGSYLQAFGIPKLLPHLRILKIGGLEISFDDIAGIEAAEET